MMRSDHAAYAPLVSVIVPAYNRAHVLRRAVASVLAQTVRNIEVIIVDDCSDDGTELLVRELSREHDEVAYLRHDRRRGAGAARNTGERRARGVYLAFLDSDDAWLPEKLEKQLSAFERSTPQTAIVYTGACIEDEVSGASRIRRAQDKGDVLERQIARNIIGSPSRVMIRRSAFRACGGFDESLPAYADWDLWIRVASRYYVECVDEPLVRYAESADAMSADPAMMISAHEALWSKHRIGGLSRRIRALHHCRLGHRLFVRGVSARGRYHLVRALAIEPWRPLHAALVLLSLLGRRAYKRVVFMVMKII